MAWQSDRPVPWRRLFVEWAVVSAGIVAVMLLFFDDQRPSAFFGLLWGGAVYLLLGYVMAKLGYQRATLRSARARAVAAQPTTSEAPATRPKPPPTRRTNSGANRRKRPTR
jgi:hypothetical protein